jgi:hypothetical protein
VRRGTWFGIVACTALPLLGGCSDSTTDGGQQDSTGVDPSAGSDTTSGPGSTSDVTTSETTSTGSSTSTQGGDAAETVDPPVVWDLGAVPDAPEIEQGCTAVDFLFVIDNSGSMGDEQANLVNNWPAFITGIQSTLTEVDSYQVGVTTTDPNNTYNIAGCQQLGSLVVQTGGNNSSMATCGPYSDGYNFMTENDDLAQTFTCAASVGTSGDLYELPMNAVEAVATKTEGGAGECNEGYIRDNALLVIVIITDEADGPGDPDSMTSTGTPQSWYDTVVASKQDIPENVAVLSLVNYNGGPCPPVGATADGQNIVDFTNLFAPNGFVAGICEPDYGPIFQEAIAVIEQACENFIPPG